MLTFHNPTCYAVRVLENNLQDKNSRILCTNQIKYEFPGIGSLNSASGCRFALAWSTVKDSNVKYHVFSRLKNKQQPFDFSSKPIITTKDTLIETKTRFSLNDTVCFAVRFSSDNAPADANTKELCSDQEGVADFQGVDSVVSPVSGIVNIGWVRSVHKSVVGYRVYQGNSFSNLVGEVSASQTSLTLQGQTPGERAEFGVRAIDKHGREDANTKTISVLVSDAFAVQGDFPGCLTAEGQGSTRIKITVAFPPGASIMQIFRNGILVGLLNAGNETFLDEMRSEGTEYLYRCQTLLDGIPTVGTNVLVGSTLSFGSPVFAGISDAKGGEDGKVKVTWSAPGAGPRVKEFRIYMVPGSDPPDISSNNLVGTAGPSAREFLTSVLGDELRYSFVVTACSFGGLCTGDHVFKTTNVLPDRGAATTPGVTEAKMVSGRAVLTVPWSHEMGAIAKRRIYARSQEIGTNSLAKSPSVVSTTTQRIGDELYDLVRTEDVTVERRYHPPTELSVTGIVGQRTYYFIVQDVDPNGHVTASTALVSMNSGDLNPPVFGGISQLQHGPSAESQLVAKFTAIAPEGAMAGQAADGASAYLVYVTEAVPPSTPHDPCFDGVFYAEMSALDKPSGSLVELTLSGLKQRTNYSVCIKAKDAGGNVSQTSHYASNATKDITAPVFMGVETVAYNSSTSKLMVRWNQADTGTSNDLRLYKVKLWRCTAQELANSDCTASTNTVLLESPAPAQVGTTEFGIDVARGAFIPPLASNEKISVQVQACDNAFPTYSAADNCSLSPRTVSITLPDIDPPPNFLGIENLQPVVGAQGALRVSWAAPGNWTDYRGFKVYRVNSAEELSLLKDCSCSAQGCPEQPTSCDVNGLDARRTYGFFVRAYDAAGNHTALPASPYAARRMATTLDLDAPTFVSNLNLSFNNLGNASSRGVALSWAAAVDNQSASEPGAVVTYKVYRKVGSPFAAFTANSLPNDGSLVVSTAGVSFLNPIGNLTGNTTEYYAVCAFDASNNFRCDPAGIKQVTLPRLLPPSFTGLTAATLGNGTPVTETDKSITVTFFALASESADPTNGVTSYPVYITEAVPPAQPMSACEVANSPVLHGSENGLNKTANQIVNYVINGLNSRKSYSVCVKARDSFGNESNTASAFNLTTQDITPPIFAGLQSVAYNTSNNKIDLVWNPSTSADLRNYRIKIWKMLGGVGGTASTPVTIFADKTNNANGYAVSKTDFNFTSNDIIRVTVNACDNAAPTFNTQDNCTTFNDTTYQQIVVPDTDPPAGFTGVTMVTDLPTRTTGAVRVNWAPMADWSDVRGFKVYHVDSTSPVATTLLKDCACSAAACPNNLTSCDVAGLAAGQVYKFYVRAYDAVGNESLIANPNDIIINQSFRTADLVSPEFNSSLQAVWEDTAPKGIRLNWQAATDNQSASQSGNTVGYRVYRKQGATFSALTRAAIESEGTLRPLGVDTNVTFLDTGLSDGVKYFYTVCAFDREPQVSGGNTTCDGVVSSVTTPDITPPTISGLSGSRSLLTEAEKSYNLSWLVSDNSTPVDDIVVKVYRKFTTNASDFPEASGTPYRTNSGLNLLIGEEGLGNTDMWLTYRIRAEDLAGNFSEVTFAIQSKRTPIPTNIGNPSVDLVNGAGEVTIAVSYDGASFIVDDATFLSKVTLNTVSGNPSCNKAISGSGLASRTLKFSNCTGNGQFNVSLAAGTARDSFGNDSASAAPSSNIQVDSVAPTLTVASPLSGATIKADGVISGTCEAGLIVMLNGTGVSGGPFTCTAGAFSGSVTLAAPDGSKTLTLTQTDSAQNSTSVTLNLARDTVSPVVAIAIPGVNTTYVNALVPTPITGYCETGLTVTLAGDVQSTQMVGCTAGRFSFNSLTLTGGDGVKSLQVSQTDAAGNVGTATRSVTLNSTVPASLETVSLISALRAEFLGTCKTAGYTYTNPTSTLGEAFLPQVGTMCTGGVLRVNVRFATADGVKRQGTVSVTAVDNTTTQQTVISLPFTQMFACPAGYVGVPGKFSTDEDTAGLGNVNAAVGHSDGGLDPTRDFCVMKYPAKVATSNNGGQSPWEPVYDGNKTFTMADYWPHSRASGTPWVNINRDNAIDRCKALNEAAGFCTGANCYTSFDNSSWGYRLLSNTQWQVIARNLEATGANWSGGATGSGFLWRGYSDGTFDANTDLHTQSFAASTQPSLSNPRSDAGNSDYFGTGNNATQNSSNTAGAQERRRFVLSTGTSVWDMAGNVWQWVSDNRSALGIPTADDTAGMTTFSWQSYRNGGSNRFSETSNKIFGNFGSSGTPRLQFAESVNAGQIFGGSAGAVVRGGNWLNASYVGLFSAGLNTGSAISYVNVGFRCAFLPPTVPFVPLDTGAPAVTLARVNEQGVALGSNPAVTLSTGGFWTLGISAVDAENAGSEPQRLWVEVRRKIADGIAAGDYPAAGDALYKSGYLREFQLPNTLTTTAAYGLPNETAWVLGSDNRYTRNDGQFVNYLVTVTDQAGNSTSQTFSVLNTQSCPPGYVGVPGLNGSSGAWNDPALNAGLGNVNASADNSNKQLDIAQAFCVMKYPAKVQSAGSTQAQSTVGGLFEPILNGNQTFTNTYTYTDSATFNTNITYLPDSRSTGTPWVNINRDNSIKACRALQMQYFNTMPDTTNGAGFQLLSNTQWQMIARNAESVGTNWSGGSLGSGVLNRGHSDNAISSTEPTNSWCFGCTSPSTSLSGIPNSISDLNPYFATGNSATGPWHTLGTSPVAGTEQKRTHSLSNSVTLWDMVGNVWHWVSDNRSDLGIPAADDAAGLSTAGLWSSLRNGSSNRFSETTNKIFGNFGTSGTPRLQYSESVNAGQIYGGSTGAVIRGGNWSNTSNAGLFVAYLGYGLGSSGSNSLIGFRCAYTPPPPQVAVTTPSNGASLASASGVTVSGTCQSGFNVDFGGLGLASGSSVMCTAGVFTGSVNLVAGDGVKTLRVSQTYGGGAVSEVHLSLYVDTVAPTVTVSAPAAGAAAQSAIIFSGTCEAGLNVAFSGAGVSGAPIFGSCPAGTYIQSLNLTAGEGNKVVTVSQVDLAGNQSVPVNVTVKRDNTGPEINIGAPNAASVNSTTPVNFVVDYSDAISTVASVSLAASNVTLNGSGTASCSGKTVTGTGTSTRTVTLSNCTGNGNMSISLAAGSAQDVAGNAAAAAGPGASLVIDNTAPSLTVSSPSNNSLQSATVSVSGLCETGVLVVVSGTGVSGGPFTCTEGAFSGSVTLSAPDGAKTLILTQTDGALNSRSVTRNLTRETVSPVVSIVTPGANTSYVNTVVTTPLTGYCETGLTVTLSGDVQSTQFAACTAGRFSFNTLTLTGGDGTKSLQVSQTDTAGNIGAATRSVTLNSNAPASFETVAIVNALHAEFVGSCKTAGYTYTNPTSSLGEALLPQVGTMCTGGVLRVNVRFATADGVKRQGTVSVTAVDNTTAQQTVVSLPFTQMFACPAGYVGVPGKFSTDVDTAGLGNTSASAGNADAGLDPTRDFCVMKYPAKVATSNNGGQSPWEPVYDGAKPNTTNNYWPDSRASGTPWVNLPRDKSIERCRALNEAAGFCTGANCYTSFDNSSWGYRLLSNTQWQVIARNLEAVGANWSGGATGSGFLRRGHSDNQLDQNADLHTQTFDTGKQESVSNPRSDASNSDYFGTGNNATQNNNYKDGAYERRRFVLSTGASVWDMAGNVWQWVSDNRSGLGIPTADNTAVLLSSSSWLSYRNGSSNQFSETTNKIFGNFGSSGSPRLQYSLLENAGSIEGGSGGAVARGGFWNSGDKTGFFAATLQHNGTTSYASVGFRCAFVPPAAPIIPWDTGVPTLALARVDEQGAALGSNPAVTVGAGGFWTLGISASDDENAGSEPQRLWVEVRRKIANGMAAGDYPVAGDALYKSGYLREFRLPNTLTTTPAYGLPNETAWVLGSNNQYTRNDSKYVNYLVTVTDEAGNSTSQTFSVLNTQSCPPGYVGVPGLNGGSGAWNDPALNAGLGNVNASAGNSNKQLDIAQAFCVMKYPAKLQSAGTSAAQNTVGGLFEPIDASFGIAAHIAHMLCG